MHLTKFTDYSLRTLMFLGAHPDRLCTIAEIAQAYGISGNHLMKVVNRLATAGYVEAVRGKGGGIRLARAPHLIHVGEVVRAMEDRFDIVECFNEEHQNCPLLPGCALKSLLGDAQRHFMATLDRYTLQDVLGGDARSRFDSMRGQRIALPRARKAADGPAHARGGARIGIQDQGAAKGTSSPRKKSTRPRLRVAGYGSR
jgi:Rrf2 family nitric oxide-sensitive transcriptional repressor